MKEIRYILAIGMMLAINACNEVEQKKSPPGYDLNKPEIFELPSVLTEVSGIAFRNGNADTLYAEQDEDGKLFYLKLGDKKAGSIKFSKKGDYEDLAIYRDRAILLRSDGTLFQFSLNDVIGEELTNKMELKLPIPAAEYEAMYVDQANGTIYILCKECGGQKKEKKIAGYKITLVAVGEIKSEPFFIDEKQIEELNGGKKVNLKASAMAKNIQTSEWYILSAVNKILIVTDDTWKVKNVYPLSPSSVFMQPEGIAFDKNNNLYISNEGGNILLFKKR